MKIALVVPGGVDRSGVYRVIPALLALIARLSLQHEVHVFALTQERHPDRWDLLGARIHNIGTGYTHLRAIRAICTEHRSSAFQVVQSIWSGSPGFIAVTAAKILGIPSFVHVAGGELVALPQIAYGGRLSWRGRAREAAVLRAATRVTAASAGMIDALAAIGVTASRLPLGADPKVWQAREPRRRDLNKPARLIHTASLNRVKDQATLLRALASLAESGLQFHMDIVGEDTLSGEIQQMSDRLGLSGQVRFLGFLPQRDVLAQMEAAHLMMISSLHEAGPLAVLEAGICGVPTVGTAVGHIEEWAPEAAVAVPVADPIALARATRAMLTDEDHRLRIGYEAMRRAGREDADFTARAFQTMYTGLAG